MLVFGWWSESEGKSAVAQHVKIFPGRGGNVGEQTFICFIWTMLLGIVGYLRITALQGTSYPIEQAACVGRLLTTSINFTIHGAKQDLDNGLSCDGLS